MENNSPLSQAENARLSELFEDPEVQKVISKAIFSVTGLREPHQPVIGSGPMAGTRDRFGLTPAMADWQDYYSAAVERLFDLRLRFLACADRKALLSFACSTAANTCMKQIEQSCFQQEGKWIRREITGTDEGGDESSYDPMPSTADTDVAIESILESGDFSAQRTVFFEWAKDNREDFDFVCDYVQNRRKGVLNKPDQSRFWSIQRRLRKILDDNLRS